MREAGFGWDVMRIDGHNVDQVVDALEQAKAATGRRVLILADTLKGKGVSFMEDQAGWHGKSPNREELNKGLQELGLTGRIPAQPLLDKASRNQAAVEKTLDARMPKFSRTTGGMPVKRCEQKWSPGERASDNR